MSLIVVDLETTGLHRDSAIVEVAAVQFDDRAVFQFVPYIESIDVRRCGDGLQINRYFERGLHKMMITSPEETNRTYAMLHEMLQGNTFGGSNPRFDANRLAKQFERLRLDPEPWHYKLSDVSAFGAGVLGIKPEEAPGLHDLCVRLGVINVEEHGAVGDALATVECYEKLINIQNNRPQNAIAKGRPW